MVLSQVSLYYLTFYILDESACEGALFFNAYSFLT